MIPLLCHAQAPIQVAVDLTDAPRKILHARLNIPIEPGPNTLLYPKWIPGEHGPTGPIDNFAGLLIEANGQSIAWQRDDVNMFAFHLLVPPGVTSLQVKADFLATADAAGFSSGACTTPNLAVLNWNQLLLYPQGSRADQLQLAPSVTVPDGWKLGTALKVKSVSGAQTTFEPVTLETLIDSPLLTGRYFREVALAPDITPRHFLDIAADGPEYLQLSPEQITGFNNLVHQASALFHSHHYDDYHFLLTLSDSVAHFGLEHHQSSDDRADARTLIDEDFGTVNADLLPHEFTHSWNGKYRRPQGLATGGYEEPMKGELLWVYEGLTQYVGDLLAARSGIWTPEQYRSYLAASAASLDHRPGRTWRNLQDTATAAQILYETSNSWDNWRRSTDYYAEGELIWLEADTLIRQLSKGERSLDDFCARFYGVGGNTPPSVRPYGFDDVVSALQAVQPFDWAGFLRHHLDTTEPHAPLKGLQQGGYQLEYTPESNEYLRASEGRKGGVIAWYSLGLAMAGDSVIKDVLVGSPADRAGLGPDMKIVAVNGRRTTDDVLRAAIRDSKTAQAPIQLIVQNGDLFRTVSMEYHDGERYPHLVRDPAQPDYLAAILKPLASPK